MPTSTYVFGYGSLVYTPELPDAVVALRPATARGMRRSLNKRSGTRFCPAADSYAAFDDELGLRRADGAYGSLVLGTVESPGHQLHAMVVGYPASAESEVLARMDPREGIIAGRPEWMNGYVREKIAVQLQDSGETVHAWVYLTNPDPRCPWRLSGDVSTEQKARALINATPREPLGGFGRDSRGFLYVEGTRTVLHAAQIFDPELESIAHEIRRLPGPWVDSIIPSRFAS